MRVGPKRLLLVGLALATAGSSLFALTASYPLAVAARLMMGTAGGFLYTPSVTYIFAAFDARLRGRAMGVAETGVGVGQIAGVVLLPALFAALGLVLAFLALPLLALTLGLAVALGLPPAEDRASRAPEGSGRSCGDRDFWLLVGGVSFVGMLAQVATLSWLPTYLRQVHGYGVMAAGISTAVVVIGLIVFSPLFGALSDRLTARKPVMLFGCGLALVGWLVLVLTSNPVVAIAAAFVVSTSMAATIPMQVVFTSERFAAVGAGAAIGLINTGGQLAASLGGPIYGAMLDSGLGFGAVWGTALALGVLRLGAVMLLRERPRAAP